MGRLIDIDECAEILGVTKPRAYELLRQRIVPSVRLGRQVRVDEDQLRKFIASGGRSLPGGWRQQPAKTRKTAQ